MIRSRVLWVLYALWGLFSFFQNSIAPAIPFLRAELNLDYTWAALHVSVLAVGMLIAGLIVPLLVRRFGVVLVIWAGQLGTLVGLTGLILAPNRWVSLASVLLGAVAGTCSFSSVQALAGELAGKADRGRVFLEGTIAASLTAAAAPLVLLLGTSLGMGWRILWPVFLLSLGLLFLLGNRALSGDVIGRSRVNTGSGVKFPVSFLWALLLVFVGVGVEWCVGFWSAVYLKRLPGVSLGVAAAGTGVFQLASTVGRIVSSRVTGRVGERRMFFGSIVLVAIGFPFYWSLWDPVVSFVGLAICGLGVSNFYPLALSRAVTAGHGDPVKASSWATGAAATAILLLPLGLGSFADAWGLSAALLGVPVGLAVMFFLILTTGP